MLKRHASLVGILAVVVAGTFAACAAGPQRKPEKAVISAPAPAPADRPAAPETDLAPAPRPAPIARRQPFRRPALPLPEGGRSLHVALLPEERGTMCRIDSRWVAALPAQRDHLRAVLVQMVQNPDRCVAVLDIHPRVPHGIVTQLLHDLTACGITRVALAATAPPPPN